MLDCWVELIVLVGVELDWLELFVLDCWVELDWVELLVLVAIVLD